MVLALATAACTPPEETYPSGGFPLRYTFGGGAQLSPSYEPNAAVACSTVATGKHFCRHVYGYEEGGANYTYYLSNPGVLSYERGGQFGWELVTKAGGRYEGCAYTGPGRYAQTWICDYRANWHTFYSGDYSYFKIFKDWASVITSQATCAAAWGTWWKGALVGTAAWTGLARDCGTYPYNPGNGISPPAVAAGPDESANIGDDPAVTVVEDDPIDPALPLEALGSLAPEGRVEGLQSGYPVEPTLDAGNGTLPPADPALTLVVNGD